MLKKLYNTPDSSSSRISQTSNYQLTGVLAEKKTQEKKPLKKNYSSNELRTSNVMAAPLKGSICDYEMGGGEEEEEEEEEEVSDYNEESSMLSK